MMGRIGRIAQNDKKDGEHKPQLPHRPNVPPVVAGQHHPHQVEGMKLHSTGGSMAVIGILFRLLDSDHNGSLSLGEFQRIGSALNGPGGPTGGPSAGPHPSLHSAGPRMMQRPQIAQKHDRPHGGPSHGPAVHGRPEHGPKPQGHGPEKIEPKHDSHEKPGDHPRVEEHRPENGPGRGERGRRRGQGGRDRARPTEAPLMSVESDWI